MAHISLWKYLVSDFTSSQILVDMSHLHAFSIHEVFSETHIFGYSGFFRVSLNFRAVIATSGKYVIGTLIGLALNV
jgi:hypothetical protein